MQKKSVNLKTVLLLSVLLGLGLTGCSTPRKSGMLSSELSTTSEYSPLNYRNTFCFRTDRLPPVCPEPVEIAVAGQKTVVRILGFDAVGWRILNMLLPNKELPNTSRLICSGTSAVFVTDWGFSPVSWTTIATGKDMEKHGILANQPAFTYTNLAVQTGRLWEMFESQGATMAVGRYYFYGDGTRGAPDRDLECQTALELISANEQASMITMLEFTDVQFHISLLPFALKYTDWSDVVTITPACQPWVDYHAEEVMNALKAMDKTIGEVLTRYPNDTLLVVSDHGQCVKAPWILVSIDPYVMFPDAEITGAEYAETVKFDSGITLTLDADLHHLKIAAAETEDVVVTVHAGKLTLEAPPNCSSEVLKRLTQRLANLTDRERKVLRRSANGYEIDPDYLELAILTGSNNPEVRTVHEIGTHGKNDHGIFIAYGPMIRAGYRAGQIQLVDFVPTVLYLAGFPVGRDMDGEVALEVFKPEFTANNPVQFIDSYDSLLNLKRVPGEKRDLSQEERKKYQRVGYPGLN